MSRAPWLLLVLSLSGACKRGAEPTPAPAPSPPAPRPSPEEIRARNALTIAEQGGAFVLTDGAHRVTITLPQRPTIDSQTMREGGVEVFNSQAIMPGGPVDAQFGAATVLDGPLPPQLIQQMSAVPQQLAAATGGTLAQNQAAVVAGHPARAFEVIVDDGRRLFGWYVQVEAHARVYQLNCVGPDGAGTRAACGAILASLAFTP